MQIYQRKDEAFQILHKVEESSQSIGVFCLLHLRIRSDLRSFQTDFLLAHSYDEFLLADLIWLGPLSILALQDAALDDDSAHFINDSLGDVG